jgi:hypothetical protein
MEIAYRPYAAKVLVGNSRGGRLVGVTINNKLAVIASREDLSVGLVGNSIDGIIGYTPRMATTLMANIIESVLPKPPPPATTQSTTRPTTGPATAPTVKPQIAPANPRPGGDKPTPAK